MGHEALPHPVRSPYVSAHACAQILAQGRRLVTHHHHIDLVFLMAVAAGLGNPGDALGRFSQRRGFRGGFGELPDAHGGHFFQCKIQLPGVAHGAIEITVDDRGTHHRRVGEALVHHEGDLVGRCSLGLTQEGDQQDHRVHQRHLVRLFR